MTCIVGVEFDGKVYMGGDIQGTGGNHKIVHTQPKVFRKKNVIFGYTTSYRFGQILEHKLADPVTPESAEEVYRWLITVLIPDMKAALVESGYTEGGNCLIGVREQLWELQTDFSILRSVRGYSSVGSGQEYALGSMCTVMRDINHTVEAHKKAVAEAIKVASIFSPTVGSDSTIIST